MRLVPREIDCLLVHSAGRLAQQRLCRGVLLNVVEVKALIACQLLELIRDGYAVSQLMQKGKEMLGYNQVLPGVSDLIFEVQVEGTFPDGTKLVTVHEPICRWDGDLKLALYGTFLPVPDTQLFYFNRLAALGGKEYGEGGGLLVGRQRVEGITLGDTDTTNQQHLIATTSASFSSPLDIFAMHPSTVLQMKYAQSHERPLIPGEIIIGVDASGQKGGEYGGKEEDRQSNSIPPLPSCPSSSVSSLSTSSPSPSSSFPISSHIPLNFNRPTITLTVTSHCDRPIQVGSHFHFAEVNPRLAFDRLLALGGRLNLPAGQSVRFEPGQTKKVELVQIGGKMKTYGGNYFADGITTGFYWYENDCANGERQGSNSGMEDGGEECGYTRYTENIHNSNEILDKILHRMLSAGFLHNPEPYAIVSTSTKSISRALYCHTFGPTVGDILKLADTSLYARIEHDFAVYGDECKFGGGKVMRDGMGQMGGCVDCLDVIITNAVIIDAVIGIVKADIGIKKNRIVGIGKGGNPNVMDGVHPSMVAGAGTDIIAGEGLIVTAGGIDAHVHFICPQLCDEALASGLTTLIGGGTGPSVGSCATTCTPGSKHIKDMAIAVDELPLNFGFTGKGNSSKVGGSDQFFQNRIFLNVSGGAENEKISTDSDNIPLFAGNNSSIGEDGLLCATSRSSTLPSATASIKVNKPRGYFMIPPVGSRDDETLAMDLAEQIEGGAIGLKLHEDFGTTPASIDSCLRVADAYDVQVTIHTDSLNEAGCLEETLRAIGNRPIHTYHTEGAGGGHAPDIIRICGEPNVLPSSTNPTRPFTVNTIEEHVDMLMVCHHLDKNLKEDLAFSESRIRAETIQAEDILHDLGSISMISSDSQAMGRIGEVICRTWQTADKMKKQRGVLKEKEQGRKKEQKRGRKVNEVIKEEIKSCTEEESVGWRNGGVPRGEGSGQKKTVGLVEGDNYRIRRYIAKYTINPAIVHGISHLVGSVEAGKWADLVLWKPGYFGIKPEMVLKGGQIVLSQMGIANGSIPTSQPFIPRQMFGAAAGGAAENSILFVSKTARTSGIANKSWGIKKHVKAVKNCRNIGKNDMVLNDGLFNVNVDSETYRVSIEPKAVCRKGTTKSQLVTTTLTAANTAISSTSGGRIAKYLKLREDRVAPKKMAQRAQRESAELKNEGGDGEVDGMESYAILSERGDDVFEEGDEEDEKLVEDLICDPAAVLPLAQRYTLF